MITKVRSTDSFFKNRARAGTIRYRGYILKSPRQHRTVAAVRSYRYYSRTVTVKPEIAVDNTGNKRLYSSLVFNFWVVNNDDGNDESSIIRHWTDVEVVWFYGIR